MSSKTFRPDVDAPEWKGGHSPYDIIKEGTIALVVVGLLTIILATLFGSPDDHEGDGALLDDVVGAMTTLPLRGVDVGSKGLTHSASPALSA